MKFALSCDENPGDPGAVHSGIIERDLNIAVALACGAALTRSGQKVWADFGLTYSQRVVAANANGSDVLVACAHNASSSPLAEGAQLIICPGGDGLNEQLAVAQIVGQQLVADGIAKRSGVVHEAVVECCDFDRCSVYCEFLFETNPRDVARIKTPGYARDAGESLARGLARAFRFQYVAPTAPPPSPAPSPNPTPPAPVPAPPPVSPAPAPLPAPPAVTPTPTPTPLPEPAPIIVPPITPPPVPEPAPVAEAGVGTSEWSLVIRYLSQLFAVGTVAVFVRASTLACPAVAHLFGLGDVCSTFHPSIPADLLQLIVGLELTGAIGVAGYAVSRGVRKIGTGA